jgi:hypothetical protein
MATMTESRKLAAILAVGYCRLREACRRRRGAHACAAAGAPQRSDRKREPQTVDDRSIQPEIRAMANSPRNQPVASKLWLSSRATIAALQRAVAGNPLPFHEGQSVGMLNVLRLLEITKYLGLPPSVRTRAIVSVGLSAGPARTNSHAVISGRLPPLRGTRPASCRGREPASSGRSR